MADNDLPTTGEHDGSRPAGLTLPRPVPAVGVDGHASRRGQIARFRTRRLAAIGIALLVVLATGFIGTYLQVRDWTRAWDTSWPTAMPDRHLASMRLHALAETVQAAATDTQPGATSYLDIRRWEWYDTRQAAAVAGVRTQTWRTPDGSGRITQQTLQSPMDTQGVDIARLAATDFTQAATTTTPYGPGGLSSYFTPVGKPASDPQQLIGQLIARQCGINLLSPNPCPSPPAATDRDITALVLDAVAAMHHSEIPDRAARKALLSALGSLPDLHLPDTGSDASPRHDVTVWHTSHYHVRRSLSFDQRTGELLAVDIWVPGGPGLSSHTRYTTRARVNGIGDPPATQPERTSQPSSSGMVPPAHRQPYGVKTATLPRIRPIVRTA